VNARAPTPPPDKWGSSKGSSGLTWGLIPILSLYRLTNGKRCGTPVVRPVFRLHENGSRYSLVCFVRFLSTDRRTPGSVARMRILPQGSGIAESAPLLALT
jgi:hypothetical protein